MRWPREGRELPPFLRPTGSFRSAGLPGSPSHLFSVALAGATAPPPLSPLAFGAHKSLLRHRRHQPTLRVEHMAC